MPLTLLLDLDDTLLDTNMGVFIPAYFKGLSNALAGMVDPDVTMPALLGGARRMLANIDPARTLQQVFDAYFFPALGLERSVLQPVIDRFYENGFLALQEITRPRPAAVDLVKWAFSQGFRLVIATNPLFPLPAIEHRMRWAGLPPEEFSFALITSYETFHFTKTSPAYYTEILGRLGWPQGPLVMAGDDENTDILPARAAGLPVYQVVNTVENVVESTNWEQGMIEDLRTWLDETDRTGLQHSFGDPVTLLALLRGTPAAIAGLTNGLPGEKWRCQPKAGEWRLTEIACHLRDVEKDVNLPRLQKILAEENPFINAEVTDRWVEDRDYANQDGRDALMQFTDHRKSLLQILDSLDSGWNRPARHAIFGPTSVRELVRFIGEHDQAHVRQALETAL